MMNIIQSTTIALLAVILINVIQLSMSVPITDTPSTYTDRTNAINLHNEGSKQPYVEGNMQLNADGNKQHNAEGNKQPNAEGNKQLNADGNEQPNADGNKQPNADGNEQPNTEGSKQPYEEANEQPNADGNEQPNTEGNEHLNTERNKQPNAEGNKQPNAEGNKQHNAEVNKQLNTKGKQQPNTEENKQPNAEGNKQPNLGVPRRTITGQTATNGMLGTLYNVDIISSSTPKIHQHDSSSYWTAPGESLNISKRVNKEKLRQALRQYYYLPRGMMSPISFLKSRYPKLAREFWIQPLFKNKYWW